MLKEDAGEALQYLIAYRAMFNKYQLQYYTNISELSVPQITAPCLGRVLSR